MENPRTVTKAVKAILQDACGKNPGLGHGWHREAGLQRATATPSKKGLVYNKLNKVVIITLHFTDKQTKFQRSDNSINKKPEDE